MRRILREIAVIALLGTFVGESVSAEPMQVSPQRIEFRDAFSQHQILVESAAGDLTLQAVYRSSAPEIVAVDEAGCVSPRAVGKAIVTVTLAEVSVEVPVEVTSFSTDRSINFRTEIEPLLTRYSCNSGGCHGKATGQNGFKLSLFGFDADFDYAALVSEARGRRVNIAAPEESLLLQKAVGAVPHGGGQRFDSKSEPYQLLVSWIRGGAEPAQPNSPTVVASLIEPTERLFQAESKQQLRVTRSTQMARSAMSPVRPTTRVTSMSSPASIDQGLVTANVNSGEAAIMARYHGAGRRVHAPSARMALRWPRSRTSSRSMHSIVCAVEKWKKLGLLPSPACDDADLHPPHHARPLRASADDRRDRQPSSPDVTPTSGNSSIDQLLDSPDYPALFAMRWGAILRNSQLAGSTKAAYAFHNWIKDDDRPNRPYDEFVRGIVAAAGEWQDAPAINWYWQSRDDQLHTVTADTAQVFLGIRLQCAALPSPSVRALGPGRLLRAGRVLHAAGSQELWRAAAVLQLAAR